jgi:hypothetical protein
MKESNKKKSGYCFKPMMKKKKKEKGDGHSLQGTALQRAKNEIFYFFENALSTHVCQSKRTCKPCKLSII